MSVYDFEQNTYGSKPTDLVHGPAVQVVVGEDLEGELVLVPVPLDRLQRVVPIARDALVYWR